MKALLTTLALAVVLTPFAGAAQTASSTSTKSAKSGAAKTATGTIVSATDTSLVISGGKSAKQSTYVLNSSTKKTGDMTAGTKVTVHYKMSGSDMVATSVTASSGTAAASTGATSKKKAASTTP